MDLLQLEYFVAVAKCEHMSKAAEKLHISQPTLSQVIARLENELGVSLFDRKGRHIKLNDQGKYLLERATYILSYISRTKFELQNSAVDDAREIYLRMKIGHLIFAELTKQFNLLYPYIKFNLILDSNDTNAQDAINVCYNNSWTDALNGCYLFDDEICLLVSRKSVLADRTSVNVAELKAMNFINNQTQFLKEITQPYCERAGFIPNFVYKAINNSEIKFLVSANYGIAFWPHTVLSEVLSDDIKVLKLKRPLCIRSLFLTFPEHRDLTAIEQLFVDFCKNYFANLSET